MNDSNFDIKNYKNKLMEDMLNDRAFFNALSDLLHYNSLENKNKVAEAYRDVISKLLDTHVIIKIGDIRHPDADLFHIAIENPELQLVTDRWVGKWSDDDSLFYKNGVLNNDKALMRYKIKTELPEYEYEYVMYGPDGSEIGRTSHLSDDEATESMLPRQWWKKDENSRREKKT